MLAFVLAAAALSGAPVAPVVIAGGARCPRADEVADRLVALLPAPDGAAGSARASRASIDEAPGEVVVSLHRDGRLIGVRRLAARGPCAERALAAAIVIATWESDVLPEYQVAASPRAAAAPRPGAWEIGAGLSGAIAGRAAAIGASALAAIGRDGAPLGGRLLVAWSGRHEIALGPGEARWSRLAVGAGPSLGRAFGRWGGELHLLALAGRFRAGGVGFPVARGGGGWDPGAALGLRLRAPGARRVAPWIEAGATRWLRARTLVETTQSSRREVPAWSVAVTLGASFVSVRRRDPGSL